MADTTKIYENIFIKKNAAGDREYIKVPYAILADPPTIPDVSGFMPKSGGTFIGDVTFNKKINLGQGDANCLYLGSDGRLNGPENRTLFGLVSGATTFGHQAYSLHFRGSAARPQYTTDGSNYKDLALKSDIPAAVTESTVSGWGFTKNKGTVTSVAVKMNGVSKGTVTSSGTIDLGTVITAHQDISGKLDKTTYEVNETIDFGSSGVLYVGKFKVYDTNVTCEVTSTTNVTYSGKLVIATQNYAIAQMTVYGDAANTVAPNFFVKPSTTSNPYIEVCFKSSSWSKNVVHIYGSNIQAEPTDVCTNVPSVPSTATLKPKNALPTYSLSGTTLTITL